MGSLHVGVGDANRYTDVYGMRCAAGVPDVPIGGRNRVMAKRVMSAPLDPEYKNGGLTRTPCPRPDRS